MIPAVNVESRNLDSIWKYNADIIIGLWCGDSNIYLFKSAYYEMLIFDGK